MGYVTRTKSTDKIMVSHTFESYDDFVKWSMIQDDAVPNPFSEEIQSDYTLTLTEHEAYTLRILLGHTFDDECASINRKLDDMFDDKMDLEDYDRLYFQVIEDDSVEEIHGGDKDVSIRFKG